MDVLKHHKPSEITVLVRDASKESIFKPLGVHVVVGSVDDVPLLSSLVQASDVVFNFAVPFGGGDASIQAMVDGLEARARSGNVNKPVLIHTTGSGAVLYGADGEAGTTLWKVSRFEEAWIDH